MLRVINSNDTDDQDQARGAYVDAVIKSLEATQKHPALEETRHQKKVFNISSAAKIFTKHTAKDQSWENHRVASPKFGNRAYTVVKLQFKSRSFRQQDAKDLEQHVATLGYNHVEFTYTIGKPRIIIRIGLD